jgi:hypothetical protein
MAQQPGSASAWRSKVMIENTAAICDAVATFELDVGLIEGPCHQAALAVTPSPCAEELQTARAARRASTDER